MKYGELTKTINRLPSRAIAVGVLLLVCVAVFAQTSQPEFDEYGRWINGITEPWTFRSSAYSENEADLARNKWKAIGAADKATEWSGDYRAGDLHASFLRWSSKGEFVLISVFTCEANVTNVDYGSVSLSEDFIELHPVRQSANRSKPHNVGSHHGPMPIATRYVPVKWGPDQYLVAEKDIPMFGEYLVGVGMFARNLNNDVEFDYFWRSSGDTTYTSAPIFPRTFEKFARKPINAEIVSVSGSYVRITPDPWWNDVIVPVTISAGTNDGVKPRMSFFVVDSPDNETIEVTRAGPHTSKAVIRRFVRKAPGKKMNEWDDDKPVAWTPVHVGWRVTTSSTLASAHRR